MLRRTEENVLKDKEEKMKNCRGKALHYGSFQVCILQQRKGCYSRLMAPSPSTSCRRHVANPATTPVACNVVSH